MEQTPLYMTVLKADSGRTQSLEQIDLHDVDFIETENRRIIYHIGETAYYQINSKSELDRILIHEGFGLLDRPNLVNLRKIRKFDERLGKVFFVENPDSKSKFATVAQIKYQFVQKLIHKIVSHNNDTTEEIRLDTSARIKHKLKGLFERR